MTKDKELKAIFIMMQDLKNQVKILSDKVAVLSEARHKTGNCQSCSKAIQDVQQEVQDFVNFRVDEAAKMDEELSLVDKAMDRLLSCTNDLRDIQKDQQKKLVNFETKLEKLCAPQTNCISVHKKPPQFSRSAQCRRSKPDQFRRVRICYNCRREGHKAKDCPKPNPRSQNLRTPPKPRLCDYLKRKQPIQA